MPWLADLVENSEGSFSVLPVQCLCEFLLNDALAGTDAEDQEQVSSEILRNIFLRLRKIFSSQVQSRVKKRKAGELLAHLQQLLRDPASEAATCLETLDYFLARYLHVH